MEQIVLLLWNPVVLLIFLLLPVRRAVVAAYVLGWLFLPPRGKFLISGLPEYDKNLAVSLCVIVGIFIFDRVRWRDLFRVRRCDLPVLFLCFVPFLSSITNGLGAYDGLSGILRSMIVWGIPVLVGRTYFADREGLRDLAVGFFLGGLVYVPLCLFEIRMAPVLHIILYGYHQHHFAQAIRFGGYRPTVFMRHGLEVGMWMAASGVIGFWLWRNQVIRVFLGVSAGLWLTLLLVTTLLCKSMGAIMLLLVGIATLASLRRLPGRTLLVALALIPPTYSTVRVVGGWDGQLLIDFAAMVSEERRDSIAGRLGQETILVEKALQRPVFGWGGWGRSRVYDEYGTDISTTDGQWVIALGENGLAGLLALGLVLLAPVVRFVRVVPPDRYSTAAWAPGAACAVMLALVSIDLLFNGLLNPVYYLVAGGLAGLSGIEEDSETPEPAASTEATSARRFRRTPRAAYRSGRRGDREPRRLFSRRRRREGP